MDRVISADSHVQEPSEIVERDGARYLIIDGRRPRRLDIADVRTTEDDRNREFREGPSEERDIEDQGLYHALGTGG